MLQPRESHNTTSLLLRRLIEPASQDGEGEHPFGGDEAATEEEPRLVAGEFGRGVGNDLFDDRPHGEGGSARVQAGPARTLGRMGNWLARLSV